MDTAIAIPLLTALTTIVVAIIYNIVSLRAARREILRETEDKRLADRKVDSAAQIAANESLAKVTEQMAVVAYGAIDRLQLDLRLLHERTAQERIECEREIASLHRRISMLAGLPKDN